MIYLNCFTNAGFYIVTRVKILKEEKMIIKWQIIVIAYIICFIVATILGLVYVFKNNNRKDDNTAKDSNDYNKNDVLKYLKIIHK